jgi:hypothetical protein
MFVVPILCAVKKFLEVAAVDEVPFVHHRGTWLILTGRPRCRRTAMMLVTALPALIPKLIVRVRYSPARKPQVMLVEEK